MVPPIAISEVSQEIAGAGHMVILTGTASKDPEGDRLTYYWNQTSGPRVNLTNANSTIASFLSRRDSNHR